MRTWWVISAGSDLDVEPNYGASAGLFWSAGYVNAGINVNYRVRGNLTAVRQSSQRARQALRRDLRISRAVSECGGGSEVESGAGAIMMTR